MALPRTLRPSQSGNLREGSFTFRAEVPRQIDSATAPAMPPSDSLRKSASAGPLSARSSPTSKPVNEAALARASPTKSKLTSPDSPRNVETHHDKKYHKEGRRGEGYDRSRSNKGSLRRGKSFATSEEAAQAMRREQADRERRQREKEQRREERRRQDHARRKQNDPLLATRLALMGLAGPLGADHDSETTDDVASAATAGQRSPDRVWTPPGWELRQEPFRPITISSPPATNEEVLLDDAPHGRAAMRHANSRMPYSESAAASALDSRTSFKTAEETVRKSADEEEASDSEAETLHQQVSNAQWSSSRARNDLKHLPPFVSPPAARPVSAATMATVTSTGTSLALLDFPKPPSRQSFAQVSDDGTILSVAHLSSSGRGMTARAESGHSHPNQHGEQEPAHQSKPPPPTSFRSSKATLLDLHGHTRPVSGRLGDSPRGKMPELVSMGLPSPNLRSQHASIISENPPISH